MQTKITQQHLDDDAVLYKRLEQLRDAGLTETQEYKDLYHQYHVKNDDIRMFWKTY